MAKIYQSNSGVKFLFFTNYKVMNSNLARILREYFPDIRMFSSLNRVTEYDQYLKLAIVRNPYDRLLSLFMDKCRAHPFKVRNRDERIYLQKSQAQILRAYAHLYDLNIELVAIEKEISKQSSDYLIFLENLKLLEKISFPEFVQITAYLFETLDMDAHFYPQSRIMSLDNKMIADILFKLENIEKEWKKICKLLSTDMLLSTGSNRTNFDGPDKYKRFYNKSLQQTVEHLYKADFDNFSYNY